MLREALADPNTRDKMAYDVKKAELAVASFDAFKAAYIKREGVEKAGQDLRDALADMAPAVYASANTLDLEIQYNKAQPFVWAWMLYLCAAVTTLFALYSRGKLTYKLAIAFFAAGFGLHVYGFVLRCIIAGRPPVSNMYESVIWVGFGAVAFSTIFELRYRKGLYMLAGSTVGFLCLVIMNLIPILANDATPEGASPRIGPLPPVLRDNFWLTIHVLTITLSYAAFMLAWGMGHITLWAHLTRPTQRHEHRELHQLVYRVMQVGVLLLATGTILGGVWANYSWGRFWGWDPKETWALIALLCYLVVLHGRFSGLWTNFGLAFGSVFCFQAIMMAWYGVNFVLGSGKHAYGAGAGGQGIVLSCVAADMVFLGAATFQYLRHKNAPSGSAGNGPDRAVGPDGGVKGGGGNDGEDDDDANKESLRRGMVEPAYSSGR
jgi:cytochrome c-type biogenesis protein CcsB